MKKAAIAYCTVLLVACYSGVLYEKREPSPNQKSVDIQREIIKTNGGCANPTIRKDNDATTY